MSDDGNGRVTMAVLRNELEHTRDDVRQLRFDLMRYFEAHNQTCSTLGARIGSVERMQERDEERWLSHREQHQQERGALARLSAAMSAVSGGVATVASWLLSR